MSFATPSPVVVFPKRSFGDSSVVMPCGVFNMIKPSPSCASTKRPSLVTAANKQVVAHSSRPVRCTRMFHNAWTSRNNRSGGASRLFAQRRTASATARQAARDPVAEYFRLPMPSQTTTRALSRPRRRNQASWLGFLSWRCCGP